MNTIASPRPKTSGPEIFPHFPPPWAVRFGEDDFGVFASFAVGRVEFPMRWIMPGTFRMGSGGNNKRTYENEKPAHDVTLTKGFWLGETPVTQDQWVAAGLENPSYFSEDGQGNHPVENVDWDDSQEFIGNIGKNIPDLSLRLPTEAEWEYACRAGTTSDFNDGSRCSKPESLDPALDQLGWFNANSGGKTHPVKEKKPNAWGLYDMHGNVWEWCQDWYGDYNSGPEIDPSGPDQGRNRVLRGGSWIFNARLLPVGLPEQVRAGQPHQLPGFPPCRRSSTRAGIKPEQTGNRTRTDRQQKGRNRFLY